jgi:hypothetical protein
MLSRSILIAAVALLAGEASAFWRMQCAHLSYERVDPIDAPGKPAGHAHAVLGSNNFNKKSTNETLETAKCTTCQATEDRSSYWVPNMYWQDDSTGELNHVDTQGTTVYYFLRKNGAEQDVTAFPPGFRMIAGYTDKREFKHRKPVYDSKSVSTQGSLSGASQDELQEYAIGFNCVHYGSNVQNEDTLARAIIPQPCKAADDTTGTHKQCDTIRAEYYFPSCWDGESLDSDDHKSHVQYPSNVQDGDCPDSHPVRLPSLLFETWYDSAPINDKVNAGAKGKFVMSNGDDLGAGYHADFMNAWNQDVLEKAVKTCKDPGGLIENCSAFELQDIKDSAGKSTCTKPESDYDFPDEDCEGPIKELPGDNPIGGSGDSSEESGDDTSSESSSAPESAAATEAPSSTAPAAGSSAAETPAAANNEPATNQGYATITQQAAEVVVTETAAPVYETVHSYGKRVNQHRRRHAHAHHH